ncbi:MULTISPECIES: Eco29kI family restriction endonuclease [Nocardiopsis]|uniref:Eco29kI family restriction endonuclease n=1 Tax=Nocardiopsis TaxID=2013 RepID=UPI0018E4F6CC|nr:Eco29kI family restriction endonuclease [Nocardiopsis sp. TNDT3]
MKDQLAQALAELEPVSLSIDRIEELERRGGIYQLYHNDNFVYVGKADKNLPQRIAKHFRKISGRQNISIEEMKFTCLYVDEDFPAVAPEKLLIATYRELGGVPWNTNGFGNNDPGRRRDETVIKVNHFDFQYPIDLGCAVHGFESGIIPLRKLLAKFKKELPYNFRYAVKDLGSMGDVEVALKESDLSASDVLSMIGQSLSEKWQIAVLHGYVIMYPDRNRNYPSAWRYYRDGGIQEVIPQVDQDQSEIPEEDGRDEED